MQLLEILEVGEAKLHYKKALKGQCRLEDWRLCKSSKHSHETFWTHCMYKSWLLQLIRSYIMLEISNGVNALVKHKPNKLNFDANTKTRRQGA